MGGWPAQPTSCCAWGGTGLAELADAGWEVGSHTRSHPRLPQVDDAALARELGDSRELIAERLGRPCESIAYPYGDFDERVVRATAAAGYRPRARSPGTPTCPAAALAARGRLPREPPDLLPA